MIQVWSLIHHSLKAKQGAEWGMRHGTGGQQAVGQTLPRFWHSCKKGGRGKKYFIFAFFFGGTHFCVGHDAKIFFSRLIFFCGQQHLVPGIKCFRKSLGFVRYCRYVRRRAARIRGNRYIPQVQKAYFQVHGGEIFVQGFFSGGEFRMGKIPHRFQKIKGKIPHHLNPQYP